MIINFLQIGRKANLLINGTELVYDYIRNNKASLVIICSNASLNTKKRIFDKCKYYNIECIEIDYEIIDKIYKYNIPKVLAIIDNAFAKAFISKMKGAVNNEKRQEKLKGEDS